MTNKNKYYVSMTDKFMGGWGRADGKINKLVLVCDTHEEAETVARNARARGEMKHVNICTKPPKYSPAERYLVQYETKEECPRWYQEGAFKE